MNKNINLLIGSTGTGKTTEIDKLVTSNKVIFCCATNRQANQQMLYMKQRNPLLNIGGLFSLKHRVQSLTGVVPVMSTSHQNWYTFNINISKTNALMSNKQRIQFKEILNTPSKFNPSHPIVFMTYHRMLGLSAEQLKDRIVVLDDVSIKDFNYLLHKTANVEQYIVKEKDHYTGLKSVIFKQKKSNIIYYEIPEQFRLQSIFSTNVVYMTCAEQDCAEYLIKKYDPQLISFESSSVNEQYKIFLSTITQTKNVDAFQDLLAQVLAHHPDTIVIGDSLGGSSDFNNWTVQGINNLQHFPIISKISIPNRRVLFHQYHFLKLEDIENSTHEVRNNIIINNLVQNKGRNQGARFNYSPYVAIIDPIILPRLLELGVKLESGAENCMFIGLVEKLINDWDKQKLTNRIVELANEGMKRGAITQKLHLSEHRDILSVEEVREIYKNMQS